MKEDLERISNVIEIRSICFPVTLKSDFVALVWFNDDMPSQATMILVVTFSGRIMLETKKEIPSCPLIH